MLSFPANLSTELRDRHTSAYWYIKLYYGTGASFTGLSDKDRILDGVKYRGLVLDWGGLSHSVALDEFKVSVANLNSLTISNADDKIAGGRFSDLFSTNNYVNRKFILYMGAVGVAVADHAQIAQGIITDQVKQNIDTLTMRLVEDTTALNIEVPTNRVNTTDHPNAPAINIGKPIPMAYGDFGIRTDIGTIPTSGAEFDRYFVKGYFPAIITDQWNKSNFNVVGSPDAVALNAINDKNISIYTGGQYSPCEDTNTDPVAATPVVTFKGDTWRSYFPLNASGVYESLETNYGNSIDSNFSTGTTFDSFSGDQINTAGFSIPKIPKLGNFISISVIIDFGAFSGPAPVTTNLTYPFEIFTPDEYELTWNGGDQTVDITASFTTDEREDWAFEGPFLILMDDNFGGALDQSFVINEIGFEIAYTPVQNLIKETFTESVYGATERSNYRSGRVRQRLNVVTPEVSEYIYYSGKGRQFGAWVDADSRNNGYDSGDLIENPVYIIEDILRTELGLTTADINIASFDAVGNTTNGTIVNVFDQAIGEIQYAFSQYQFTDGWGLCQDIARYCGCVLFKSGDGTVKIVARQRSVDYTSADRTLEYGELGNISPGITPLAQVRNKATVKYKMDYAQDVLLNTSLEDDNSTSQGSGANGINAVQELILDNRFILDSDTAYGYCGALVDWLAYRKKTLAFDIMTPRHNDLEIGDTLVFSGWPSTFKIYGNQITSTDIYMITKINKTTRGCSINCQEVSEVSD